MNPLLCFRINSPKVAHEIFDDEVVIINFESGNYFSLEKVGVDIWDFLQSGATVSEIIEGVSQRYKSRRAIIESAVNQFLSELQQEEIIVADNTKEAENVKGTRARAEAGLKAETSDFETPVLKKYSDMQELLLLDPIHEVDDGGWPIEKPDSKKIIDDEP